MSEQPAIVMVHGLWMKPWTWSAYRRFFIRHGYRVHRFGYRTTGQPMERSAMKLAAFVNSRDQHTVHLLVHSMGGLLAMQAMPHINKPGKLVMLGSPVQGSRVARKLQQKGWHRTFLRHATKPLTSGVSQPHRLRPSLMIAGTRPMGLGRVIERQLGPGDGTVALAETRAEWIDEHREIHTSHFGLLLDRQAMQISLDFLSREPG
jgi:pimeloyl-ACP methyl ester carboxylesterase